MKSAGARAVVAALPTSTSPPPLALLDFQCCGIDSVGAEMLVSDLVSSTRLQKVVMSRNRISRRVQAALTSAVATTRMELVFGS